MLTFSMTYRFGSRNLWNVPYFCLQCASKYSSLNSYSSNASDDVIQRTFVVVKRSSLNNEKRSAQVPSSKFTKSTSDKPQAQGEIINSFSTQMVSETPSSCSVLKEYPQKAETKLNLGDDSCATKDIAIPGSESALGKPLPEAPTTCCQSGCPNCVWLDYAEQLSLYYKDGGQEAVKAINRDIDDPNLREYLLFEIRMKFK